MRKIRRACPALFSLTLFSFLLVLPALLCAQGPQPGSLPYELTYQNQVVTAGQVVDFGEVPPGQTPSLTFWIRNLTGSPLPVPAGSISVAGSEFVIPAYPSMLEKGGKISFTVRSTGQGLHGTVAQPVTLSFAGDPLTFRVRQTVRLTTEPCSLEVTPPLVATQPLLWWEAEEIYPDCPSAWWTLDDGVSPEELAAHWRSVPESRARYQAALGSNADPAVLDGLLLYVSGADTPELIPLWKAFALFSEEVHVDPAGRLQATEALAYRGLTPNAIKAVARLSGFAGEALMKGREDANHELLELEEYGQRAFTNLGESSFLAAYQGGDVLTLAQAAGTGQQRLVELLEGANRNLPMEAAMERLEQLLAELPLADWLAFRQYLYDHFASRITVIRHSADEAPEIGGRAGGIPNDPPPGHCPISGAVPPQVTYVIGSPIYDVSNGTGSSSEQRIDFRHRAVWNGPASMLGCHKYMTVGCKLNYEGSHRGGRPVTDRSPPWDVTDGTGTSGSDVYITGPGASATCFGISESIPRCDDFGIDGRDFHGWVDSVVFAGMVGTWGSSSAVNQTGVGQTDCFQLADVGGPIQGLPTGESVTISVRSSQGIHQTAFFNGSSFFFADAVPVGSLVDFVVASTSSGVSCHFPNGLSRVVPAGGLTNVVLECCPEGTGGCDSFIPGFSVNGLDENENLTVTANVGGLTTGRLVGSDDDFLPLSTQPFPAGTPFHVGYLNITNELKTCEADPTSGNIGSTANFGFSGYRLFAVTCACTNGGTECEDPTPPQWALVNLQPLLDTIVIEELNIPYPFPPPSNCDYECSNESSEEFVCIDPQDPDTCVLTEVIDVVCRVSCSSSVTAGPEIAGTTEKLTLPGGAERLEVNAVATDADHGIAGFAAYLDDDLVDYELTAGSPSTASYQRSFDLESLASGQHTFSLMAVNADPSGGIPTMDELTFEVGDPGNPGGASDAAQVVSDTIPTALACGQTASASVTVRNTGNTTWRHYGARGGYKLGWGQDESDPLNSPWRIELPDGVTVPPGATYTFNWTLEAPPAPGSYVTDWRMVHEGVRWFGQTLSRTVTVSCSELSVPVAADAWVGQDQPGTNRGFTPELRVRYTGTGYGRYSFLRFNVPQIPGTLLGARLRLRTQETEVGEAGFYWLSGFAWGEGSVTWDNWDDGSPLYYYMRSGRDMAPNSWHEIDVSEAVTGSGTVNLGIASGFDAANQDFWSSDSQYAPTLIISYAP